MQVTIPEHTARALNREFEDKLVSAVLKRFSSKLFLLLLGELLEEWTHKKSVSDLAGAMTALLI